MPFPTHARRSLLRYCRLGNGLTALAFLLFAGFVVASNDFDWDHFLSAAEVDLRSWIIDGAPPLWSYQLCGGVTRAGDPQAFGLSPLILIVLLLGSFWGLKLGVVLLALLGFWGMNGLLYLFYAQGRPGRSPGPVVLSSVRALSLAFVLGNYFLWHFHHGHLTFALDFLALGLLRILVESFFRPVPRWWLSLAAVLGWTYFSAGFYHSLIFFLLPLTVGLVLALVAALAVPTIRRTIPPGALRRLAGTVSAALVGLAAGAYKPYLVATFQMAHPRTVESSGGTDGATLLQTALSHLAPTFDYLFLGISKGEGTWGIWERSAFSLNSWICLLAVAWLLARRLKRPSSSTGPIEGAGTPRVLWILIGTVTAVGLAFTAGDAWPVSAHRVLNALLDGSVRVAGRYQIILSVAWAWLAALLIGRSRSLRRGFFRYGVIAVSLLVALNLLTFRATFRPASVAEVLRGDLTPIERMQLVSIVSSRTLNRSFMYGAIMKGQAVLNCYDPIWRVGVMSREFKARPELMSESGKPRVGVHPLIDLHTGRTPESCALESYFTQSEVHLDDSCPPGTCVNLNAINEANGPLQFSSAVGKFCLPSP
ncbi:MAG: hypothetical protein M3Q75_11445 [Gemmatimonadota bacterium]|nr:hypothetical protein [Gemmatimonadota bacterium]